ncbi:MAG: hypothetical protein ACTSYA_12140 [Candidatus Kariarchaeaceae archaeon]
MQGIMIKIKEGHKLDGEGESLGSDANGKNYTFWRSSGQIEVPVDVALRLEKETPQRYEMVDRNLASHVLGKKIDEPVPKEPLVDKTSEEKKVPEGDITLSQLNDMRTKDDINDWAAKRDYDVNPSRQTRNQMIESLVKQIEERTKKPIKK